MYFFSFQDSHPADNNDATSALNANAAPNNVAKHANSDLEADKTNMLYWADNTCLGKSFHSLCCVQSETWNDESLLRAQRETVEFGTESD